MTDELLEKSKETCLLPVLVLPNTVLAQIAFDTSLIITMGVALFFVPFLSYLVFIQTQNFIMNQTTNTRFSKVHKSNLNEQAIKAMEEFEESEEEDDDFMVPNQPRTNSDA